MDRYIVLDLGNNKHRFIRAEATGNRAMVPVGDMRATKAEQRMERPKKTDKKKISLAREI